MGKPNITSEEKSTISRRHLLAKATHRLERAGLRQLATVTAVVVGAAGCGGGGGGSGGGQAQTVYEWTVANFSNVEGDPDYLTRVGNLQLENADQGLIFLVNGQFPPDNADLRSAQSFTLKAGDAVSWHLVVRDEGRLNKLQKYLVAARQKVGGSLERLVS